ncbi:MAG: murein transglycosylase D [Enterobacteriaceae bacterium]
MASVLLVGCQVSKQNAGHRGQNGQNAALTAAALKGADGEDIAAVHQRDLWRYIGNQLQLDVPDNARVKKQKHLYLNKKSYLQTMATRAEPYMYWIIEQVKQRKMPMEVALLPMVESAFNPHATSPAKAAGLWQIVPQTGRNYGLKQDKWYDGRRDVIASTSAALDILQNLNNMFDGDWLLTIAAYNSGEGRVMQAIKRNKAKGLATDYWSLQLPKETELFVPKMLALSEIIKNNSEYGLHLPKSKGDKALSPVDPGKQVDLAQVSEVTGVPLSQLKSFNPGYKGNITAPNGPHTIMLPRSSAKQLKSSLRSGSIELASVKQGATPTSGHRTTNSDKAVYQPYRVRPGDTITGIAKRLNVSPDELKQWNSTVANRPLKIGQQLQVANNERKATDSKRSKGSEVKYRIRKGDSLSSIARRHGVNVDDVMRWNNELSKNERLQPGDTLTLYVKPRQNSIN